VEVDQSANMYLGGMKVDTLVVQRRQLVHFVKRNSRDTDFTILFERKLIRERHRVRVVVTDKGVTPSTEINRRARMKVYRGRLETGSTDDQTGPRHIYLRVVPPAN
jgi:hypothetical protein